MLVYVFETCDPPICRAQVMIFFFSSRRRHTRYWRDWSSDVCSSDLFTMLFATVRMGNPVTFSLRSTATRDVPLTEPHPLDPRDVASIAALRAHTAEMFGPAGQAIETGLRSEEQHV